MENKIERDWPLSEGLHYVYVGLAGLEPATSCTQSTRASQAALQPVLPEHNRHVSDAPPTEGRSQAINNPCLLRL